MPEAVHLVLTTFGDKEAAERVVRPLIECRRLAACASILPGVRSIYRWKGAVEDTQETLVLFKTSQAALPALMARLKALHPYEVPEILAVETAHAYPNYAAWVAEECPQP